MDCSSRSARPRSTERRSWSYSSGCRHRMCTSACSARSSVVIFTSEASARFWNDLPEDVALAARKARLVWVCARNSSAQTARGQQRKRKARRLQRVRLQPRTRPSCPVSAFFGVQPGASGTIGLVMPLLCCSRCCQQRPRSRSRCMAGRSAEPPVPPATSRSRSTPSKCACFTRLGTRNT